MSSWFAQFEVYFRHYGLVSVLAVLLLENFGLPLPGELALLYAGYHARVHGSFGLWELIAAGTAASIAGQAGGYALGRYAGGRIGPRLPLTAGRRARYERYIARHGGTTVLFARFVTGLRIFAGLLAGLGGMRWRRFLAADALGALLWVTVMAETGSALGAHWHTLLHRLGRVELLIAAVAAVLIVFAWRRIHHE